MKRFTMLMVAMLFATCSLCSAQDYGGLNGIRFNSWEEKDWYDNDYLRELRSYIDAVDAGEIEDEVLGEYKELLSGKFIVAIIEPAIFGGLYIGFNFYDAPSMLFFAHVYSYVDEESESVIGYDVRGVIKREEELDFTQEEFDAYLEEEPLAKLW
jgi:hypothetical protein